MYLVLLTEERALPIKISLFPRFIDEEHVSLLYQIEYGRSGRVLNLSIYISIGFGDYK
jgi:hypothetical protein